jgi:glycosyltransferase involved in cell wall biosynthesis
MESVNKILFVASHLNPFAQTKGGDAQRTHLLLQACSLIGKTEVICFSDNVVSDIDNCRIIYSKALTPKKDKPESRLRKWMPLLKGWQTESFFPRDKEKSEIIRHIIKKNQYDYIITRYLPKAVECGLLDFSEKLIIDIDDLPAEEFMLFAKSAHSLSGTIRNYLFSKVALLHTRRIVKNIRFSFFSNPRQVYKRHAAFLPNIPYYQKESCTDIKFSSTKKRIFFVGDLSYYPNYNGIDYFLEYIYTPLQKRMNDVEFHIAGANLSDINRKKRWGNYPNVTVLGYVENIVQEYTDCRVVVVPVYKGAGTNIKVLEAMQMNRACIVSTFAARGYTSIFENEIDYYIAQNTADYIKELELLLTEENINQQMAAKGHAKIKRHYSFSSFQDVVKLAFYEQ